MTSSADRLAPPTLAETNTNVLFLGTLAEHFGESVEVALPAEGCSVEVLRDGLGLMAAGAAAILAGGDVRVAVDRQVMDDAGWVRPGQEVAFFSTAG